MDTGAKLASFLPIYKYVLGVLSVPQALGASAVKMEYTRSTPEGPERVRVVLRSTYSGTPEYSEYSEYIPEYSSTSTE
jgi:hypothetical protein